MVSPCAMFTLIPNGTDSHAIKYANRIAGLRIPK